MKTPNLKLEILDKDLQEKKLGEFLVSINKDSARSFNRLSKLIKDIHQQTFTTAVKAVNRIATIRNFLIGFYIVEYEQKGKDKANYGEKLLKNLEERIQTKGLNETLFKNCRKFYLNYPHIKDFLYGKSPTTSDKFITPAERIITR